MGLGDWACLAFTLVFTVLMLGSLMTYVGRMFRETRPNRRRRP